MRLESSSQPIRLRVHLAASPAAVYSFLATDEGRARFWAESAVEQEGHIVFQFPNGQSWRGQILEADPARVFRLVYFGGSETTFHLADDGTGGTDLTLADRGVPPEDKAEVLAGWTSVLMALKAAVDFGVDLRNHDPSRSWDQGFVDN
jgi:uncharacterized protein YndB with AHSA1/START domain